MFTSETKHNLISKFCQIFFEMFLKVCIVPCCGNTSDNQPEKLFVRVPKNPIVRKSWQRVLGLTKDLPQHSKYCCCEDHFNLAEDCTNWSYFCTVGRYLSLKPDVDPHLYVEHAPSEVLKPQMSESSRKRKAKYVESVDDHPSSINAKRRLITKGMVKQSLVTPTKQSMVPQISTNTIQDSPSRLFIFKVSDAADKVNVNGVQENIKPKVCSETIEASVTTATVSSVQANLKHRINLPAPPVFKATSPISSVLSTVEWGYFEQS